MCLGGPPGQDGKVIILLFDVFPVRLAQYIMSHGAISLIACKYQDHTRIHVLGDAQMACRKIDLCGAVFIFQRVEPPGLIRESEWIPRKRTVYQLAHARPTSARRRS